MSVDGFAFPKKGYRFNRLSVSLANPQSKNQEMQGSTQTFSVRGVDCYAASDSAG